MSSRKYNTDLPLYVGSRSHGFVHNPPEDFTFYLAFQPQNRRAVLMKFDINASQYDLRMSIQRLMESIRDELPHFRRHEALLLRIFAKLEVGSSLINEVCTIPTLCRVTSLIP